MPREDSCEDQPVRDPARPAGGIGDQPKPAEIDLQLHPGIPVEDRDRRPPPTKAQLVNREAVQRPIRHHHPAPAQQQVHLDQRQVLVQPLLDLCSMRLQRLPSLPDPARSVRAHGGNHLADQRVGQLGDPAVLAQPGGVRGLDITAHGLAVHPASVVTLRNDWPSNHSRRISFPSITDTSR
jgi:hypothetical protein